MYISRLTVKDFKRVETIDLRVNAEGQLIEVCGDNGHGKTSTIDAVWSALGGRSASPEVPIRQGRRQASVRLDLKDESLTVGDLIVTRRWDAKGSTLYVSRANDPEGTPVRSPQTLLDSLYSHLAFDPLEFLQMAEAKQAETLRRMVGLDLSDLDARRKTLYEERTQVNAAVKSQRARLAEMPEYADAIDPVNTADLTRQLREAMQTRESNYQARVRLNRLTYEVSQVEDRIVDLERQIAKLRAQRATLLMDKNELEERIRGLTDPDTESLTVAIEQAEDVNRRVRANRERTALAHELQGNVEHAESLTRAIDGVDQEKLLRLSSVQFPVPDLSIDGDTLTLRGVPFGQASMAERLKACLGITGAMNPALKVILVREGSCLDPENLKVVAQWAADNGYQVFLERVHREVDGSVGVVIREGKVTAAKGVRSEVEDPASIF